MGKYVYISIFFTFSSHFFQNIWKLNSKQHFFQHFFLNANWFKSKSIKFVWQFCTKIGLNPFEVNVIIEIVKGHQFQQHVTKFFFIFVRCLEYWFAIVVFEIFISLNESYIKVEQIHISKKISNVMFIFISALGSVDNM